jgi:IrrE N-terminal-like domain
MSLRQLRRRCEARLRALDLPSPFDVREFCEAVGRGRGRPISLRQVSSQTGPCGLWVAGPSVDYIFYEGATSPLHQEHIILHELSHLLCSHRSATVAGLDHSRLFPDLDAETVRRVLLRATYSQEEEQEAELLASLILSRMGRMALPASRRSDPAAAELLDRLEVTFEQPRRHD